MAAWRLVFTANASAKNWCCDTEMPGVMNGLVVVTFYWPWHSSSTSIPSLPSCFSYPWVDLTILLDGSINLSRRLRHGLSYVRNYPFLPRSSRHAYFLIERWLFYYLLPTSSDEDTREKHLCSLMYLIDSLALPLLIVCRLL